MNLKDRVLKISIPADETMPNKDKVCRHQLAWVVCGGYGLWCPECGAYRPMKFNETGQSIIPRGGWHRCKRDKGKKPVLKLYPKEEK